MQPRKTQPHTTKGQKLPSCSPVLTETSSQNTVHSEWGCRTEGMKEENGELFCSERWHNLMNARADPTTCSRWREIVKLLSGCHASVAQQHWNNVLNEDVKWQATTKRKMTGPTSHFASKEDATLADGVAEVNKSF
jgi:hypothetical protein